MTLEQWMKLTGKSIKGLAHDLEVQESTIWRWMNNTTTPPLRLANRIHVVTEGAVSGLDLETSWVQWKRPKPRQDGKPGRPRKVARS